MSDLTEEELLELREIIENDKRMKWLWAMVRRSAGWLAGIAAGLVAFRDDIARLFGWLS